MADDNISIIWPEWHVVKVLGKGSYGVVYEAERNDAAVRSRAAIKVISIPQNETEISSLMSEGMTVDHAKTYYRGLVDSFVSEIRIMESLKGVQNIVSVEDYKVVEKSDRLGWDIYIRMELLTPFNDYIVTNPLDENGIADLGIDICTALERCARLNVIHRDIKPENIFVNNFGDFKLGDFGIARHLENASSGMSIKGTYNYMAPEIEKGDDYDATVDTYSLGLVLYRLANDNRLPFLNAQDQMNPTARVNAARRRLSGETLPDPCNASSELAQIIQIACQPKPENRFKSATAMKNALRNLKSELAAGTVKPGQSDPDKTVKVRTVKPDPDRTISVRAASGVMSSQSAPQPQQPYQTPQRQVYHETVQPANRRNPAKIIIPIAIAATVTAALVILAIIFIPKLLDNKDSSSSSSSTVSNTVSTTAATEATQSTLQNDQTEATSETAVETTVETTVAETESEIKKYASGDIYYLGHYEQDGNTSNGMEDIEWLVLEVQDDKMLVISLYGLDGQQYDTTGSSKVTWETCTLRSWLNNSFLNTAFSVEEQAKIQTSYVTAQRNAMYMDRDPGNDTWDKMFLLSTAEAEYYFGSDSQRKLTPTSYAISRGVTYSNNKDDQGYGYWWWLRNPGRDADYAALVFPEGAVDYVGYHFNDTENAVRPVMWVTP